MMLGYLNDGPAMIVIDTVGLGGYPTYGFFWGRATGPPFWITGVMYVVKHLGLDH